MIRTTAAIVDDHKLSFPETFGHTNAKYGVLQSVAAIPLYLASKAIEPLVQPGNRQFVRYYLIYCTNALLTALLLSVFYGFSRYLRYPRRSALAATAGLGLTTIVFPYAKFFASEPLVGLLMLCSVFHLIRYGRRGKLLSALWSAVFFGLGLLTRVDGLLLLPVYLLALLMADFGRVEFAPRVRLRRFLCALAAFSASLLVAAALLMAVNVMRFGSPLSTGYSGEGFTGSLLSGVFGLLWSPGRGLFIYSPALLAVPFIVPRFVRRRPLLAMVILEIVALKLFFYGKWWTWQGGLSWGSRFLVPVVPLLFLAVNEPLMRIGRYRFTVRALIGLLLVAGLFVQCLGVVASPLKYAYEIFPLIGREEIPALFIPQLSPIAGNLRYIGEGQTDLWVNHFDEYFGRLALLCVALPLGAALLLSLGRLCRLANLRPVRWISSGQPVVLDWYSGTVLVLVVLNVAIFAVSFLALEGNRIPRDRLAQRPDGQWEVVQSQGDRYLAVEANQPEPDSSAEPCLYRWQGWIVMPVSGMYAFHATVLGQIDARIGQQVIFSSRDGSQQDLAASFHFDRGVYPIAVEYRPAAADSRLLRLYWTLPGYGTYRAPLSHADVFASQPTRLALGLAALNRFKLLAPILSLMLLWALHRTRSRLRRCG